MRHHHRLSLLSVFAVTLFADLAAPLAQQLWDDMRPKHAWDDVPANWKSLGPPSTVATIDIHIALKAHHEDALIDALYEVSDPSHPKYGAHLSKEQVAELVAPHPETLGLVNSWLKHHGVFSSTSLTHGGGWLTVTGVPVSQANILLGASYQLYRHTDTNETVLRTVGYALPSVLHAHVHTIVPTTQFTPPRMLHQTVHKRSGKGAKLSAAMANATSRVLATLLSSRDDSDDSDDDDSGDDSDDEEDVTPTILRWLYNTAAYVPVSMSQNILGIADYQDQNPSLEDFTEFMTNYRSDAESATFNVVQINGGLYDPKDPKTEGGITTQYPGAMAYPTPLLFYSIGGTWEWSSVTRHPIEGDSYLEWLKYLVNNPNIPPTISTSYGNNEMDLPKEYATELCKIFAQIGLRGTTFIFASGNDGVGKGDCKDSTGKVQFIANFPASCPWVTSVGGTTKRPEIAASLSKGGFSSHFLRPKYQNGLVPRYLTQHGTHAGLYDPEGRGIPDISAQALNFAFILNNEDYVASGTSCSTPVVAGIISLLNDFLIFKGRRPLGFVNPWLYGRGLPGINDITIGSNPGCRTEGFSAVVGWDPVTGLGTPDFVKLQDILIIMLRELEASSTALSTATAGPSTLPTPSTPAE